MYGENEAAVDDVGTLSERLEFIREIESLSSSKCAYVSSFGRGPLDMTPDQKRYYAYFRTTLNRGAIKGDEGYYRTLVLELLSTESGRVRLYDYLKKVKNSAFYNYASMFKGELDMYFGVVPEADAFHDALSAVLTKIFFPSFSGVTSTDCQDLSLFLMYEKFDFAVWDEIGRPTNRAFVLADEYFRQRHGKSIGTYYSGDEVSQSFALFNILPEEERPHRVSCYRSFDIDGMCDLVSDVFRTVHRIRGKSNDPKMVKFISKGLSSRAGLKKALPIPNGLGGARIISFDGGAPGEMYPPPCDPMLYEGDEDFRIEGLTEPLTDALARDLEQVMSEKDPEPAFRERVWITPEGIQGKKYYAFWRHRLIADRLYDFNEGCLELLYLELKGRGETPKFLIHFFGDLWLISARRNPRLGRIIMEMLVLGDLPVPSNLALDSGLFACLAFRRAIDGRRQALPSQLFAQIFYGYRPWTGLSEEYWNVFRRILSRIFAEKRRSRRDWVEEYGMHLIDQTVECVFGGTPEVREVTLGLLDSISPDFVKGLVDLQDYVVKSIDMYLDKGQRRRKSKEFFGVNVTPWVNDLVEHMDDQEVMEDPAELKLDKGLVRKAEEDLMSVIGMIAKPEDEMPPTEPKMPEPVAVETTGDGWERLVSMLNEDQRSYLRKCLGAGKAETRIEKEVNSVSLDVISDTIVEDGAVVEEYREDVERVLRTLRSMQDAMCDAEVVRTPSRPVSDIAIGSSSCRCRQS